MCLFYLFGWSTLPLTAWPPRDGSLHHPSCWVLVSLSHRGRRVNPRITQSPFVLCHCPACDTHGGCTRQAAPRIGGSPLPAPTLLLRGIPGEARTEGEGRSGPPHPSIPPSLLWGACCGLSGIRPRCGMCVSRSSIPW